MPAQESCCWVLLLLIAVILVRRKKKKQENDNYDVEEYLAAAAARGVEVNNTGADVMSMQSERSIELRKDIRKFAEDNPEIAAQKCFAVG